MHLKIAKMDLKKYIRQTLREELLNENTGEIICYHSSDSLEHMKKSDFRLEKANDLNLFGYAIYFSESPNISQQLGKYLCKFSIKLDEPVLDMNKRINGTEQKRLLDLFNKMFKLNITTDINDKLYPNVQFGDLLVEISDIYDWDYNKYYYEFIRKLGYNSFKYFGNYHTDFINQKGDYGSCYGLYNTKNIKFIDGPF